MDGARVSLAAAFPEQGDASDRCRKELDSRASGENHLLLSGHHVHNCRRRSRHRPIEDVNQQQLSDREDDLLLYDPSNPSNLEIDAWSRWVVVAAATFLAIVFIGTGTAALLSSR